MKAIIMAGGKGTRLRPVCGDTPKPLAKLLGRPLIDHTIYLLREHGFSELIISLGHGAERIASALTASDAFGPDIRLSEETQPLGTAGGVRLAWDRFCRGEHVLVISGDAACDLDLSMLRREHLARRPALTMALHRRAEPLGCGLVITDADGYIKNFIEKPDWPHVVTDLVNTGIYILSPEVLELVPQGACFDFARGLFPLLLERGAPMFGVQVPGYWCDAGTPEDYFRCNLDALQGRLRLSHPWSKYTPASSGNEQEPTLRRRAHRLEIPCINRASVMRLLSESLAGRAADFSDGLVLDGGLVRISPSGDKPALVIEADGEDAAALCCRYGEFALRLAEALP